MYYHLIREKVVI